MSTLKVAVLGAGGTIAPAIVRDLAESDEAAELLLLDLDGERARAVAESHGAGKARAQAVDAHGGLSDALAEVDVLVNAASYRVNLDAMQACLAAGCQYLDLGGLYWMTGRQLELDASFKDAGLLGLLGMGSSPGKTNVMAAAVVRKLDETPKRIDVLAAGRDLAAPDGFSVPYALRTLVDEVTMPPVVLRDREPQELEPLADGGNVRFPEPVGEAATIHTLHSEIRTFGDSFDCAEASFRLALEEGLLERLRELARASDEQVAEAARTALPSSAETVSVHVVEAEGVSGRVLRCCAVTRPIPDWGLGGGIVSTAAPAAAAVRMLARGEISARGVMPPERCVEPELLFPELARRNCQFDFELVHEEPVAP
jgi:saccharopine dehydrogenase-like NADP-dependent oxidoreductase